MTTRRDDASPAPQLPPDSHPDPGVVASARAEADLAIRNWLLHAAEYQGWARDHWWNIGVTMLPTGKQFSAIKMSERLVLAAVGKDASDGVAERLASSLRGPVIHDPPGRRYYALVPPGADARWAPCKNTEALGRGAFVGVPRPGITEPDGAGRASYWVVPMTTAGELCVRQAVVHFVALGRSRLAAEAAE